MQVDGSETGETIPLRPLIQPARKVDFIVAFDASTDGAYEWVNGTNLQGKQNPHHSSLKKGSVRIVSHVLTTKQTLRQSQLNCIFLSL